MKDYKNKVVAVIIDSLADEYVIRRVCMLYQSLKKHGMRMVLVCGANAAWVDPNDLEHKDYLYNKLNYKLFDAVVCFYELYLRKDSIAYIYEETRKHKIPFITIDFEMEGSYPVYMDYKTSYEQICRHIAVDHGCKRIAYMSGRKGNAFSEEREDIFRKTMQECNVQVDESDIYYGDFWAYPTTIACKEMFKKELPEAIICANDTMAITVIHELRNIGKKVPNDVIVTGFDGLDMSKWCRPALSTCGMNYEHQADLISELVIKVIKGEPAEELIIPYEMMLSESCGCKKCDRDGEDEVLLKLINFHDETINSRNTMYKLQENLVNKESIVQVATVIHERMFSDGYVLADASIPEFAYGSIGKSGQSNLTDQMRLIVGRKGYNIESGSVFSKDQLIPNFNTELTVDRPFLVMPITAQEKYIGYMVLVMNVQDLFFQQAASFSNAINNALNVFRIQKYLRRVNRQIEESNEKMAELYVKDPLTKLYNRRGFYTNIANFMEKCIENDWEMFVASIDLDDLKVINDSYGHSEGDNALRIFGNALLVNAHQFEISARFGGDEFVVAGIAKDAKAAGATYVQQVEKYLEHYNRDSGKPYIIQASVGMSYNKPTSASGVDEFILKADKEMYDNKKERKSFKSRVRNS